MTGLHGKQYTRQQAQRHWVQRCYDRSPWFGDLIVVLVCAVVFGFVLGLMVMGAF